MNADRRSLKGAGDDLSALFIYAGDAADPALAGDPALDRAVYYLSRIASGKNTEIIPAVAGADIALETQVAHDGALLDIPEEASHIAAALDDKAVYPVPLPVEGAAEGRYRTELPALEIDIVLKNDRLSPRPAVKGAVFRKLGQILGSLYVYRFARGQGRKSHRKQDANGQSRRHEPI